LLPSDGPGPEREDEQDDRALPAAPATALGAARARCLRTLALCGWWCSALPQRLAWRSRVALARLSSLSARSAASQQQRGSLSGEAALLHDGLVDRQTQTEATGRDPVAERISQCVQLCGWLDIIAWEVVFVAVFVGLFVAACVLRTFLYMFLCIVGALAMLYWRCRWAPANEEERFEKSHLQLWGELHCSLGSSERWAGQTGFGLVLILQGTLFVLAGQWTGLWVCAITLCLLLLREAALRYEHNHGWWIGLAEGLVIWLVIVCISPASDVLLTLFLACLHQFGLGRFMHKGARLVKFIDGLTYVMLVIIVAATLLSVAPAEGSSWSAFAPGARNYTIGFKDVRGRGLMCEGRYASGQEGKSFSLGDFALWSSLAYESPRTMPAVLQHFFPGWQIIFTRIAGNTHGANVKKDWSTFFEYSDPDNSTSIITIRGTDTTLDVLNDINIWLTAALMEGFEIFGPWLFASVSQVVADLSLLVRGSANAKAHFAYLLAYVQRRLREDPHRQFYITGHSLGGGLAKLVSIQTRVQAVTFMAPGVARTRYSVFQKKTNEEYAGNLGLTVQPQRDIVSRVDSQLGIIVPTRCYKNPLSCHMMYEGAICPMFQYCGSMRPGKSLQLPCGQCTAMPC